MRGEASRISDRSTRDRMAHKLKDIGERDWHIGNELFTITNLLDHHAQLENALTDLDRSTDDKVKVLLVICQDKVDPLTIEIMTELIDHRWSKARDISNAVEDFAVDAMMYYTDQSGTTHQVSLELAQLHSALLKLPVLRSKLADDTVDGQARVQLLDAVLKNGNLDKVTLRLAEHATYNLRRRGYLTTIQWLIGKLSRHMGESMITITTATALTSEQIQRLVNHYSTNMNCPVHINSVVDESVIGGMRIQVGNEVTDNTVQSQLRHLERLVKSES